MQLIFDIKKVEQSKTFSFIKADGELIGQGSFEVEMVPKGLCFVVGKESRKKIEYHYIRNFKG